MSEKGYSKADLERDTMTPAKQEARSAAGGTIPAGTGGSGPIEVSPGREAVRISEFTSPDEPRFSCLVTPTPNGGWWWSVFSGDGSVPGSLVRGSSETSLSRALEAAAEWARHYPEGDERV